MSAKKSGITSCDRDRRNAGLDSRLLSLLKPVSRSFYLSIYFLPKRIRPTLTLGYLLARASDTIADTNGLAPDERLSILSRLHDSILTHEPDTIDLSRCLKAQKEGPEKALLKHLDVLLLRLGELSHKHQELLREVLSKIIDGQKLDIERFDAIPGVHALPDDAAVEDYTYRVAGCVGEFWTKLCLLEWPDYAHLNEAPLLKLAAEFGKGLQLVNILRDFAADLNAGRSYLPVGDPVRVIGERGWARPEWERWRRQCFEYLDSGWKYVAAIRPARVRFACAVPVLIGIRTLLRLGKEPELRPGIKISRNEVRALILLAIAVAFVPPLAWPVYHKLSRKRVLDPSVTAH